MRASSIVNNKKESILLVMLFLFTIFIYFISSPGETFYDYFTRLAYSLSQGKLYITENPAWLNELVPIDNKYYIVYPPMPAILLIPLTFIYKTGLSQTTFSIFLGGVNVILVYLLLKRIKISTQTSFLVTLFFAFGTNHWYLASVGSAWFIAHVVAIFFLLLALIETFGKQRLLIIGLLIGASFWARTPVIFTASFFYIFLWRRFLPLNKTNLFNLLKLTAGILFFVFLDAGYNFLRFGDFTPLSPYSLIPNIDKDPVFKDGFMSFSFIQRHIRAAFLILPKFTKEPPFMTPSLYSTAIWFTCPLLFYIFRNKKKLIVFSCWIAIVLTFFVISLWAGVGYSQFGYRFAQDFMPFLLILTALGIGKKPSVIAYLLLFLSIFVNAWSVILINILNTWSM